MILYSPFPSQTPKTTLQFFHLISAKSKYFAAQSYDIFQNLLRAVLSSLALSLSFFLTPSQTLKHHYSNLNYNLYIKNCVHNAIISVKSDFNMSRVVLCSPALLIGDLSIFTKYLYHQNNLCMENCIHMELYYSSYNYFPLYFIIKWCRSWIFEKKNPMSLSSSIWSIN